MFVLVLSVDPLQSIWNKPSGAFQFRIEFQECVFFFLFDPVSVHSLVFLASLSVWLPIKTETVRSLLQPG